MDNWHGTDAPRPPNHTPTFNRGKRRIVTRVRVDVALLVDRLVGGGIFIAVVLGCGWCACVLVGAVLLCAVVVGAVLIGAVGVVVA